jgi:hypothetical protein
MVAAPPLGLPPALQVPLSLLETVVISLVLYWLVGMYANAGYFFAFFLTCFLASMTSSALFRCLACVCPDMVCPGMVCPEMVCPDMVGRKGRVGGLVGPVTATLGRGRKKWVIFSPSAVETEREQSAWKCMPCVYAQERHRALCTWGILARPPMRTPRLGWRGRNFPF